MRRRRRWKLGRIPASIRGIICVAAVFLAGYAAIGLVLSDLNLHALVSGNLQLYKSTFGSYQKYTPIVGDLWLVLLVATELYLAYLILQYLNSRFTLSRDSQRFGDFVQSARNPQPFTPVKLTSEEARFFLEALIYPSRRFKRITETVEPYTRSLQVRSTFTVSPAKQSKSAQLMVPLVISARGRLEDGIRFFNSDKLRISSLTHMESIAYVEAAIEHLILELGIRSHRNYIRQGAELSIQTRVRNVLNVSVPLGSLSDLELLHANEQMSLLAVDLISITPKSRRAAIYEILDLIHMFRWYYPICVPVETLGNLDSPGTRFTVERRVTVPLLQYQLKDFIGSRWAYAKSVRRAVPKSLTMVAKGLYITTTFFQTILRILFMISISLFERIISKLRHFFGIRTNIVSHALTNSARTKSYHLQIKGPDEMYVGTQGLSTLAGLRLDRDQSSLIDYQVSAMAGQRHSHLHIQDGGNDTRFLFYRVSYLERTPGSMARAMLTAAAAALIVVIIALVQLHALDGFCKHVGAACRLDQTKVGEDSGLLQVLLALPLALTTSSLGRGVSLWGGILAARVANVFTLIFCFAALFVSALPNLFTWDGLHKAWFIVAGGMLVTVAICFFSWFWRANAHAAYLMDQKEA